MKTYDETRCRELLEAYYQGIISPEQQVELNRLLNSSDLPEDLEEERAFFAMLEKAVAPDFGDMQEFDAMASEMVAGLAAEERKSRWRRLMRGGSWIAAAAVAAVLVVGAVMRLDRDAAGEKSLVAEKAEPALRIEQEAAPTGVEPHRELVAELKEQSAEPKKAAKPASKARPAAADSVNNGVTDEELRLANETIDEVQAFFDSMMAEWDNADRGVRGLLKSRTLADSGEKDPEIIVENP